MVIRVSQQKHRWKVLFIEFFLILTKIFDSCLATFSVNKLRNFTCSINNNYQHFSYLLITYSIFYENNKKMIKKRHISLIKSYKVKVSHQNSSKKKSKWPKKPKPNNGMIKMFCFCWLNDLRERNSTRMAQYYFSYKLCFLV